MIDVRWKLTDTLEVPAKFLQRMPDGKVKIQTGSGVKIVRDTEVTGLPQVA